MALTRKFLAALGIEPEKVDEIISAHTDTVNALKEERDAYKADAEKLETVQQELDKANKELEAKGEDEYKQKYEDLQTEFNNYKTEQETKETTAKKNSAYRKLLMDAGVAEKRLDAVMRVTDLQSVKLGEDGKIVDADKLTEAIKSDWADFIVSTGKKGADTDNPPGGEGGNDFAGMSLTAKMRYANEHPSDPAVVDWLKK